jgi:hypothetical protein
MLTDAALVAVQASVTWAPVVALVGVAVRVTVRGWLELPLPEPELFPPPQPVVDRLTARATAAITRREIRLSFIKPP